MWVVMRFCRWKNVAVGPQVPEGFGNQIPVSSSDGSVGFMPIFVTEDEAENAFPGEPRYEVGVKNG